MRRRPPYRIEAVVADEPPVDVEAFLDALARELVRQARDGAGEPTVAGGAPDGKLVT